MKTEQEININLPPGWVQTLDLDERKDFQGDGYKMVLDVSGDSVDITIKETPGITTSRGEGK